MDPVVPVDNEEAIEAWNGVLFDRFLEFREIVTTGLGAHGAEAMRSYPPATGDRVLDIGCGFGDTTQVLGGLVGAEGSALGVDAAERFIELAREEAEEAGAKNVSFLAADPETDRLDQGPFDYAFSRMGSMFFANPVAALRNVREAMSPGGRLCLVVWRQKPDNDWVHRAEQVVEQYLEEPEETDEPTCGPGPFSMANADTTSGILRSAGFEEITLRRSDIPIMVGRDLAQAVDLTMSIGPAGEVIRLAGDEAEKIRPKLEAEIGEAMSEFDGPDGVVAPASTWIVSARAPA